MWGVYILMRNVRSSLSSLILIYLPVHIAHRCPYPDCCKDFSRHDKLVQHLKVHKDYVPPRSPSSLHHLLRCQLRSQRKRVSIDLHCQCNLLLLNEEGHRNKFFLSSWLSRPPPLSLSFSFMFSLYFFMTIVWRLPWLWIVYFFFSL